MLFLVWFASVVAAQDHVPFPDYSKISRVATFDASVSNGPASFIVPPSSDTICAPQVSVAIPSQCTQSYDRGLADNNYVTTTTITTKVDGVVWFFTILCSNSHSSPVYTYPCFKPDRKAVYQVRFSGGRSFSRACGEVRSGRALQSCGSISAPATVELYHEVEKKNGKKSERKLDYWIVEFANADDSLPTGSPLAVYTAE